MVKEEKPRIRVAVIGHVDSGKSTTAGHLIYKCGGVDQRTMEKFEKQACEIGKGSFKYAWVLDKLKMERERGLTMDYSLWKFETKKYNFTVIDTPGMRDFIKNMITGTSMADAVILMVAASLGEFEAGISKNGQTREHALLAQIFGVKQMIVCINKMDEKTVNFSEIRYNEIKMELTKFLTKIGYNTENIPFIPVSGYKGDNLVQQSDFSHWYKGPTLIEALESLEVPEMPYSRPLRITVKDVKNIDVVGTVVYGKVETGIIKPGTLIHFSPFSIDLECKYVQMNHEYVHQALPGDNITFGISEISDQEFFIRGQIASDAKNDPASEISSIQAEIVVLDPTNLILPGYTSFIDCHNAHVACKVETIYAKINRKTGEVLEKNPKTLKTGDAALVTIVLNQPFSCEVFQDCPSLGRFALRERGRTVAVGVIKKIQKKDK